MSDEETERYSFDEESSEHFLFLEAVVSIVADGTSTGGALTVTEIDAPPSDEHTLHTHPPNELFSVLNGEMTLYVDRQPHRLTEGRRDSSRQLTRTGFASSAMTHSTFWQSSLPQRRGRFPNTTVQQRPTSNEWLQPARSSTCNGSVPSHL